jgi:3-isopropylmalate dehydrogenase
MSKTTYAVACLAGDGVGPELMAEACRTLHEVSRLHGFAIEDVHVPFGSEALSRSGHPIPLATRAAYLSADAILAATDGDPAVAAIESELDVRATVAAVRFPGGDVRVISPLSDDLAEWTVNRALLVARSSRARLASVDEDGRWRELVDRLARAYDGVAVEHLSVASGLPALAFEPERFDVIVTGTRFGDSVAEVAAAVEREGRVVAFGRLSANGPGVFAPAHGKAHDIAGQGVANPSSMLLAAALMLGDGLGERAAAATLAGAVTHACGNGRRTLDRLLHGIAATTRQFTDSVLAELQTAASNAEFAR